MLGRLGLEGAEKKFSFPASRARPVRTDLCTKVHSRMKGEKGVTKGAGIVFESEEGLQRVAQRYRNPSLTSIGQALDSISKAVREKREMKMRVGVLSGRVSPDHVPSRPGSPLSSGP